MVPQGGEGVPPRPCVTEREKVHAAAKGTQEAAEGPAVPSMLGSGQSES